MDKAQEAQGALEYLIIIAAVLAIATIAVLFVTGVFGVSGGAVNYSGCKTAAAKCAAEQKTSLYPPCRYCEEACEGLFNTSVDCCRTGKPNMIYEGSPGCTPVCSIDLDCNDSNECTEDRCLGISCVYTNVPDYTSCTVGGVRCCSGVCTSFECYETSCTNGIDDDDDTYLDCDDSDCFGNNTCCTNSIMDGDEEGIDCGGSCPNACTTVCNYPATGNWLITSNEICDGENILLNGNLTIESGGKLTLSSSTLRMNCTSDGDYGVYVELGGTMNINQQSNITNGENASANYIFNVLSGSSFEMRDSYVSKAGWENVNYHRGIDIYADNTIIENCTINSDYRGLCLYSSSGNTLIDNSISTFDTNTYAYGVYLSSISNSILSNNSIITSGNDGYGLFISSSSNNNLSCNSITTSGSDAHGIRLSGSTSSNNNITNNSVTTSGSDACGVHLYNSPNNNFMSNNSITTSGDQGYGIGLIFHSDSNTFTDNSISSYDEGIRVSQSDNNTFTNNTISSTHDHGVYLTNSPNNNFTNNDISSSSNYGVRFSSSSSNTFTNNNISASSVSVYLYSSSSNNIFMNNNISSTNQYGIFLISSSSNTFTNNTISSTSSRGVYSDDSNTNMIINSTITSGSSNYDFYLRDTGNLTEINCSFDKNKVGFYSGAVAKLYVKWYLDVNVTNSTGDAIDGATVKGYNKSDNLIFTDQTDAIGFIERQTLLKYMQNATSSYYQTPYTLNTTKTRYTSDSRQVDLNHSMQEDVTLT